MKKLIIAIALILITGLVYADQHVPVTEAEYNLSITITGDAPQVGGGGSKTVQELRGISYGMYTVSYTVLVDALREIITKTWILDSTDIPEAKIKELTANPKSLICQ